MADKSKRELEEEIAAANARDDAAIDAVFNEREYVASDADPDRPTSAAATWLATTALLVSSAALVGVLYLMFGAGGDEISSNGPPTDLTALTDSINSHQSSLQDLQNNVAELSSRGRTTDTDLAELERRLVSRLLTLEPIPDRIVRLERSFSALQGISTGVQDTWLLAEAEYYMQIANAQLQLAGNPHLATMALRLADERLLQLADPALTEVRRVLSQELQALEIIEKPDIEGATLTLASLAGVVASLPLRPEVQTSNTVADTPDEELAGIDRALASLKGAIGDVVTIRRTDESVRPLIAPEAIYFLRANLSLQLQAARLALLRGEQAVFRQSLNDANAWIEEYYDKQSTPVRSALHTIREIRDSSFVTAVPDISESLRLLRRYVAFSEAAEALEVEPDVEPEQ